MVSGECTAARLVAAVSVGVNTSHQISRDILRSTGCGACQAIAFVTDKLWRSVFILRERVEVGSLFRVSGHPSEDVAVVTMANIDFVIKIQSSRSA